MIRWIALVSAIAAALVLQSTVLPIFLASSFKPDLLLVLMVFIALRGSFHEGLPLAWLLGLFKDVFSGLYLGLNAFSFVVIFLTIKSVSERLYAESGTLFVISVGLASLACFSLNLLLLILFTSTPGIAYSMGADLIPHLLVTSFAASLAPLLPWFERPLDAL